MCIVVFVSECVVTLSVSLTHVVYPPPPRLNSPVSGCRTLRFLLPPIITHKPHYNHIISRTFSCITKRSTKL